MRTLLASLTAMLSLLCASPAVAEYEFQDDLPQVMVRVPLPCPEWQKDDDRGELAVFVGANGLVEKTRFTKSPPRNAADIEAASRRWMWRPARDGGSGKAYAVWVSVPTRAYCVRVDSAGGAQRWIPRLDSTLADRLADVDSIDLGPANSTRPALGFGRELLGIVRNPKVLDADLHALPCIPESTVRIHLRGRKVAGTTTIAISYVCEFMQIESPEAVLQVPYGAVRDQVSALLAQYFPEGRPGTVRR